MKVIPLLTAIASLLIFASCTPTSTAYYAPAPEAAWRGCEVLRIEDGDTIIVRAGKREERVRLLYIDTPEKGEKGYDAARKALAAFINGQLVDLEFETPGEPQRDRGGRLLAYVIVPKASGYFRRNVNLNIVFVGWSRYTTKFSRSRYDEEFLELEREARKARRGIWQR